MDLRSSSPSDFIGGLKDRFGFGNKNDSYDGYDEYGDDEYYDYEQYAPTAEQEYADAQEYGSDSYGNNPYDRLEYTTRPTRRSSSRVQSAPLVSARDIRATTPSVLSSDSSTAPVATSVMPSVQASSSSSSASSLDDEGYDVPATAYTDFVSPYKDKSSYQADSAVSSSHAATTSVGGFGASGSSSSSSGLDSLFTPTTPLPSSASSTYTSEAGVSAAAPGANSGYGSAAQSAAGQAAASYGVREIVVVKPQVYDDVASVAHSLRSGALVVLSLRRCDATLSKRVLDFSFGVASALEARVECVADKTFVLVKGENLTLDEQHRIRQMGV